MDYQPQMYFHRMEWIKRRFVCFKPIFKTFGIRGLRLRPNALKGEASPFIEDHTRPLQNS